MATIKKEKEKMRKKQVKGGERKVRWDNLIKEKTEKCTVCEQFGVIY